jgi:predicted RNase H-like HicB family nuclease
MNPGSERKPQTSSSGWKVEMKSLVVYEKSPTRWRAYAPDLTDLVVAATTLNEVKELIREAVEFHIQGMREHGDPIPAPAATTEYISV